VTSDGCTCWPGRDLAMCQPTRPSSLFQGLLVVNNLVDINNLVSLGTALPISMFDADKLGTPVVVRFGQPDERYTGPTRWRQLVLARNRRHKFTIRIRRPKPPLGHGSNCPGRKVASMNATALTSTVGSERGRHQNETSGERVRWPLPSRTLAKARFRLSPSRTQADWGGPGRRRPIIGLRTGDRLGRGGQSVHEHFMDAKCKLEKSQ
jgi:hypothetical protein